MSGEKNTELLMVTWPFCRLLSPLKKLFKLWHPIINYRASRIKNDPIWSYFCIKSILIVSLPPGLFPETLNLQIFQSIIDKLSLSSLYWFDVLLVVRFISTRILSKNTLSLSTSSTEKTFSTLLRTKNYSRNTLSEYGINGRHLQNDGTVWLWYWPSKSQEVWIYHFNQSAICLIRLSFIQVFYNTFELYFLHYS